MGKYATEKKSVFSWTSLFHSHTHTQMSSYQCGVRFSYTLASKYDLKDQEHSFSQCQLVMRQILFLFIYLHEIMTKSNLK